MLTVAKIYDAVIRYAEVGDIVTLYRIQPPRDPFDGAAFTVAKVRMRRAMKTFIQVRAEPAEDNQDARRPTRQCETTRALYEQGYRGTVEAAVEHYRNAARANAVKRRKALDRADALLERAVALTFTPGNFVPRAAWDCDTLVAKLPEGDARVF